MGKLSRTLLLLASLALLAVAGLIARTAMATPVVRRLDFTHPALAAGQVPVRIVLIADLHAAGPDMLPRRLDRLVAQVDALHPDCVLIAGDFVSDRRLSSTVATAAAVAPLARLHPRVATIAVPGNHDHWRNAAAVTRALRAVGVAVLANAAARCGPLAIGGVDDEYSGHDDLSATTRAMRAIGGAPVLLAHTPDLFPAAAAAAPLTLAGHTHCGQIAPPGLGPLATMSRYGRRYACGVVREGGRVLVVTAGIGTSIVPIRFGAPADLWVIDVRPAAPR